MAAATNSYTGGDGKMKRMDGDAEGRDAERVRMEQGETCHNDKPGLSDGDGGVAIKRGRMRGEAGGSDGEEEVAQ